LQDGKFIDTMLAMTDAIAESMMARGKLLTCGNGGSAGDAQHIAGEFISRLNYDRAPLAAVALTTDSSVLTAVGNDYGYEHVFERQVRGLGQPGDVLLAISTSGKSPSILAAMRAAREKGMKVLAFTGKTGGHMPALADLTLHAPSDSTPLIQQVHIMAAHIVCGLVEQRLFPRPEKSP
jgi:D-sedoheptulose 7-phosphate isomerase